MPRHLKILRMKLLGVPVCNLPCKLSEAGQQSPPDRNVNPVVPAACVINAVISAAVAESAA